MPTYDFRCPIGHKFSRFYKTMSTALSQLPCPECGAVAERQLSGGGGLVFKGSGFYLTDYGKNAHRGTEKAAASASEKSGSSESAGTASGGDKKADAPAATKAEGAKPDSGTKSVAAERPKPKSDVSKPSGE
jgi:putative FmdB family regulatory protein